MNSTVVWIGRISGNSGYAVASRAYISALQKVGMEVIIFDVGLMKIVGPTNDAFNVSHSNNIVTLKAKSENKNFVVVYNDTPAKFSGLSITGRCRKIGLSFAETESIPFSWKSPLLNMDEVWVASEFNKKSFAYAGIPKDMLRVVPLCLDPNLYEPNKIGHSIYHDPNVFTFLMTISNFNRKDTPDVIRAYAKAFQNVKNVNLLLKIPHKSTSEHYEKFIYEPLEECLNYFPKTPPITIIKNKFSEEYMNRLYNTADCYLAIERAKGWDLPAFHSMALGKPVIGLNWSANTEFMNHENSILLEPNESLIYADASLFENTELYTGHKWASYNFDELVHYMRDLYDHPDRYTSKRLAARETILSRYSFEMIGERMKEIINSYKSFDFASNLPGQIAISSDPIIAEQKHLSQNSLDNISDYFDLNIFKFNKFRRHFIASKEALKSDPANNHAFNRTVKNFFMPDKPIPKWKRPIARTICKIDFNKRYRSLIDKRGKPYDPSQPLDAWIETQRKAEGVLGPLPTTAEETARLATLKNTYQGKRIFVIGNGPSINKVDFEKLKNEYTFGCNKIYLKYETSNWRPNFYTALDWRVTPDSYQEINDKTTDSICFFPKRFFGLLRNDKKTYWYMTRSPESACENNFSLNITNGVVGWGTVIYSALQIACHLGFNDIYLLGVDVDYKILNTVQQSGHDKFKTGTKINLTSTQDDDPNHFDPRYFGKDAKWHDPNVDHMIRGFLLIRKLLTDTGINIYNATPGGKLEVFPRVDFNSLF